MKIQYHGNEIKQVIKHAVLPEGRIMKLRRYGSTMRVHVQLRRCARRTYLDDTTFWHTRVKKKTKWTERNFMIRGFATFSINNTTKIRLLRCSGTTASLKCERIFKA